MHESLSFTAWRNDRRLVWRIRLKWLSSVVSPWSCQSCCSFIKPPVLQFPPSFQGICNLFPIPFWSYVIHTPPTSTLHMKTEFIHSICMCRMRRFPSVLRSFFHSSLLCTFTCHPSPPTILPSSLTSSCHLFLGLPKYWSTPTILHGIIGQDTTPLIHEVVIIQR